MLWGELFCPGKGASQSPSHRQHPLEKRACRRKWGASSYLEHRAWLSMCPCPEPQVRGKIQTHPEPHPVSSLCSACQSRYFLNKEGDFNNLTAAAYHKKTHLLVTGFASGIFHLHELPEFNLIHSLR